MYIIGLTGGIASGKTTITQTLSKHFPVVDADEITQELYTYNPLVIREIAAVFPNALEDEKINKVKLVEAIMEDPEQLNVLEKISHPYIFEAILNAAQAKLNEKNPIVIISAPLLFETRLSGACHAIICLDAAPETQKARALKRPHMTPEKFNLIAEHQWPVEKKRKNATVTISTEQSVAATEAEILCFLQRFLKNPDVKVPLISCKY